MPGLRLTRSSSSASLKLWERQSNKSTMVASTESLMGQSPRRSDASHKGYGKRRSFLRRNSSRQENDDGFSDDFSQACPGSNSSRIPCEEGIEAILPSRKDKRRTPSKKEKKTPNARQLPPRPGWNCVPNPHRDERIVPVLTASSASEDGRQERFDQSFDYAFNTIVWDKAVLDSSLVDTTFVSNSSSSSSKAPLPEPIQPITPAPKKPKQKQKWRLFSWGGRRKVERAQSFQEPTTSQLESGASLQPMPNVRDWQPKPETDSEPDWEAHIDGDQVECEYRGDVTVQDLFATVPDSPAIQRVASWGREEQAIGLEKSSDESPLPNSPGVMELGQYAREMQSKNKASAARKRQLGSLLCALPTFGKSKAREEFDDFPDPDLIDPDEDDNSYLAVSYTEEGAQLVMTQSEDLDRGDEEQRSMEDLPEDIASVEFDDPADDPVDDIAPAQDSPLDVSQLTNDDDLYFLGENPIMSFASRISKCSNSLGATYPHPAAQMRDEFALRRLRHPSPPSSDAGENAPTTSNNGFTNNVGEKPFRLPKLATALSVEKERQGSITFHHYKGPVENRATGRYSRSPDAQRSPPVQKILPTLHKSHEKQNKEVSPTEEGEQVLKQRRDDPPEPEESTRTFGYYGCPTATRMPPPYPTCTSRSGSRWLSQAADLTWDHTTAKTFDSRTLDSRTVSTLSYSVYPQQERRSTLAARGDAWDIYRPIRQFAKDVNETFCENMYPRTEQPASVPFDEDQMDGRLRQARPSWTDVVRSRSSSSSTNYYERFYRDNEQRRKHSPVYDYTARRPDPPSTVPAQRDSRRQLL